MNEKDESEIKKKEERQRAGRRVAAKKSAASEAGVARKNLILQKSFIKIQNAWNILAFNRVRTCRSLLRTFRHPSRRAEKVVVKHVYIFMQVGQAAASRRGKRELG